MKPHEIYRATAEYRKLKFLYGFGLTLLFTGLFAVMVGLSSLASTVLSFILLPVWIVLCLYLTRQLYRAVGWRLDAGHLYLITAAFSEGKVPANALPIVNEILNLRFTKKQYLSLRRRVTTAVREINNSLLSATSLVGDIPGMRLMNQFGRMFLGLHLVYMRDCCLAYTFLQTEDAPDTSSVNGCAFYSINWRPLSERASDVAIFSVAVILIPTAALGIGIGMLMGLMGLKLLVYFGGFLAFMLILTVKYSTLDVYLSIHYIDSFLHLAAYSVPSERCFAQLSRVSPAFARMMQRNGGAQTAGSPQAVQLLRRRRKAPKPSSVHSPDAAHPVVCPRCRTANRKDAKFCAGCGIRLKK